MLIVRPRALIWSAGPDADAEAVHRFTTADGTPWVIRLYASVLALRGPTTPQPLRRSDGSLFAWNGEIFGGLPVRTNLNRVLLKRAARLERQ